MILVLALLLASVLGGAPINTLVPPFVDPGGTSVATGLTPQTTPTWGSFMSTITTFGNYGLDPANDQFVNGPSFSSQERVWSQYSGAFAKAKAGNGQLSVYASATGYDLGQPVEAHAGAFYFDSLTITSPLLGPGGLGYLHLTVEVDGIMSCDVALCPSGMLFGYGFGTVDYNLGAVHALGGEAPPPGPFQIQENLVPLPFINGQPFNINLYLITTARTVPYVGNTYAISDQYNTLRVSGISVLDAQGNTVVNPLINADSGLYYGPNGISSVPEPATASLIAMGAALCCGMRRWRNRRRG